MGEHRHESHRDNSGVRIHFSRTVANGPESSPMRLVQGQTDCAADKQRNLLCACGFGTDLLTKDFVTLHATGIEPVGGREHGQRVVLLGKLGKLDG
jgi:hypothetical protein